MSRENLARLVGVSIDTIGRWERNKRSPKVTDLPRIAKALDVDEDYFVSKSDASNPGQESRNLSDASQVEECKHHDDHLVLVKEPLQQKTEDNATTDKRTFEISVNNKKVRAEYSVNDPPEFIRLVIEEVRKSVEGEPQSEKISSGLAFEPAVGGDISNS